MSDRIRLSALVAAENGGQRLDQLAAQLFSEYSRSRLQSWIKDGSLTVDGRAMRPRDILYGGEKLELEAELEDQGDWQPEAIDLNIVYEDHAVLVINKPAGLVVHPAAGHHDGTLLNALLHHAPELAKVPRAGIVHRLDKDTTGLLFLTTDGHWNHRVTAPNRRCNKLYRAVLAEPLLPDAVARLQHGILLRNEDRPTRPCTVNLLDSTCVTISISEGRYHQVKRMFHATGNHVTALHRESLGEIRLDKTLEVAARRPLTAAEIASIDC